jgi:hypothetical protein
MGFNSAFKGLMCISLTAVAEEVTGEKMAARNGGIVVWLFCTEWCIVWQLARVLGSKPVCQSLLKYDHTMAARD